MISGCSGTAGQRGTCWASRRSRTSSSSLKKRSRSGNAGTGPARRKQIPAAFALTVLWISDLDPTRRFRCVKAVLVLGNYAHEVVFDRGPEQPSAMFPDEIGGLELH